MFSYLGEVRWIAPEKVEEAYNFFKEYLGICVGRPRICMPSAAVFKTAAELGDFDEYLRFEQLQRENNERPHSFESN